MIDFEDSKSEKLKIDKSPSTIFKNAFIKTKGHFGRILLTELLTTSDHSSWEVRAGRASSQTLTVPTRRESGTTLRRALTTVGTFEPGERSE